MKFKQIFSFAIFFSLSISLINCSVVCSEDELVKELLEDLADNGNIVCLYFNKF